MSKDKKQKEVCKEEYGQISLYEINKVLNSDRVSDLEKLIIKDYYDLLSLFQNAIANKLPHINHTTKRISSKNGSNCRSGHSTLSLSPRAAGTKLIVGREFGQGIHKSIICTMCDTYPIG